ncbi:hypothetical protein ABPG75_001166 [Micractinium tetrahymenae]
MAHPSSALLLHAAPAQRVRCVAAASGGPSPANPSRRRSQRLRERGANARDLQRQLREREARLEEQQRLRREQEEAEQHQQGQRTPDPQQSEALRLQDQAMRSLLQQLAEKERPAGEELAAEGASDSSATDAAAHAAAEAEAAVDSTTSSSIGSSAARAAPEAAVEPDFILEQQGAQALGGRRPQDVQQSEISRQSEALLAIIQAGERVEEVIAERRADIDETTLKLLERRIGAAQQMEKRPEVVQGLQLLYRRLKAEVDRQVASPALRLLDELMGILDPGEADTVAQTTTQEERRRQAAARVRAAFSGGLAGDADVLSLAAQLVGGGGERLADELVADPVDPMAFMAEATQLLGRVEQQQAQLEAYLHQLRQQQQQQAAGQAGQEPDGAGGEAHELSEEQRRQQQQLLEVEGLLEQRRTAASLVQTSLDVAQAVVQQLQLGL